MLSSEVVDSLAYDARELLQRMHQQVTLCNCCDMNVRSLRMEAERFVESAIKELEDVRLATTASPGPNQICCDMYHEFGVMRDEPTRPAPCRKCELTQCHCMCDAYFVRLLRQHLDGLGCVFGSRPCANCQLPVWGELGG